MSAKEFVVSRTIACISSDKTIPMAAEEETMKLLVALEEATGEREWRLAGKGNFRAYLPRKILFLNATKL